jgi:thymidylate synthase
MARHEEEQYFDLIRDILANGVDKRDRTGTGTRSVFGRQLRFDLNNGVVPLLTTKSVFWRGVVLELLWFLSGSTDVKKLSEEGVHIWDANASKEVLDKLGLKGREEGDAGPVYGFQFRHFGDIYTNKDGQYAGVDQITNVIESIKNDPDSRRHVVCAWNPADLPQMALPPCHFAMQFYVDRDQLSCMFTMRSCDVGLGLPFNIASYALLTHMVAHVTGLKAKEVIVSLGDAHIYKDHVDALSMQITREPFPFPTVELNPDVRDIFQFRDKDIKLKDYKRHPSIPMHMSV